MTHFLSPQTARTLSLYTVIIAFLLLAITPIRSTVIIGLFMFYATAFLIKNPLQRLEKVDCFVIGALSAYLIAMLPLFVLDGWNSYYLSPGVHMLACVPIYVMFRNIIDTYDYIARLTYLLRIGILVSSAGSLVLALYQVIIMDMPRADGFSFSINFGFLNASLFALGIGLIHTPKFKYKLFWISAILGSSLFTVVLSGTRGAMLAILCVAASYLIFLGRRLKTQWLVSVLAVALILLTATYYASPKLQERVAYTVDEFSVLSTKQLSNNESSIGLRFNLWVAALASFEQRPTIGLTHPERDALIEKLAKENKVAPMTQTISNGHAHSQYFEMMASGGILGLIACVYLLFALTLFHFVRFLSHKDDYFSLMGFLFTFCFAICGLSEAPLQDELLSIYYAFTQVVLISASIYFRKKAR